MNPSHRRPLTALALSLAVALAPALAGEESPAHRAAFAIDLTGAQDTALADGLRQNLAALLAAAQYTRAPGAAATAAPRITSVDQVIEQLRRHQTVAYVVLAERDAASAEDTAIKLTQVFVVPDLIKISIRGEATATPPGAEPEASVVPGPPGEAPLIKFQFDPGKYEQPQP